MRDHHKKLKSKALGFTLIEILVVIALIALVTSISLPNITLALKINISNSNRDLANLIRSTYDEAVLKGQIYRIVFDMDKGQYWVERGEKGFLLQTAEQKDEEEHLLLRLPEEEREKRKSPFQMAKNITKSKKKLPKGVHFTEVYTSQSKEAVTGGMAYVHIFPHGFIEKLHLHMKDDYGREATLITNSVSGKSRLFERYVKEEEQ